MLGPHRLKAAFRGWVKVEFVRGARARFFDSRGEIRGTVVEATVEDYDQRAVPHEVILRVESARDAGVARNVRSGRGPISPREIFVPRVR